MTSSYTSFSSISSSSSTINSLVSSPFSIDLDKGIQVLKEKLLARPVDKSISGGVDLLAWIFTHAIDHFSRVIPGYFSSMFNHHLKLWSRIFMGSLRNVLSQEAHTYMCQRILMSAQPNVRLSLLRETFKEYPVKKRSTALSVPLETLYSTTTPLPFSIFSTLPIALFYQKYYISKENKLEVLLSCNEYAEELTGYSAEDFNYLCTNFQIFHPCEWPKILSYYLGFVGDQLFETLDDTISQSRTTSSSLPSSFTTSSSSSSSSSVYPSYSSLESSSKPVFHLNLNYQRPFFREFQSFVRVFHKDGSCISCLLIIRVGIVYNSEAGVYIPSKLVGLMKLSDNLIPPTTFTV